MSEEDKIKKELFAVKLELTPLSRFSDNQEIKPKIESLRKEVERIKRELAKIKLKERGMKK